MGVLNVETVVLGFNSLRLHKLRSLLTALGIIFGVAAVICMLSITEGASADEMRMIRLLGTQNIIVNSVKPDRGQQVSQGDAQLLDYGIKKPDVSVIRETIPGIQQVIPMKTISYSVRRGDRRMETNVVGTTPGFFDVVNISVAEGRPLNDTDMSEQKTVCVIGDDVRRELFTYTDPIGQTLLAERRESTVPYTVIGVLAKVQVAGAPSRGVEDRNLNREIYIPYTSAEARYGSTLMKQTTGSREITKTDFSGLYVNVAQIENVMPVSEMVKRVFEQRHDKLDYEIKVPLASLQLAEKKKRNQQYQLGMIAGVSLLVGGIGIMNIMLATVTERTREIGIRRALGARQRHIVVQFLIETVMLSTAGGLVGVFLGYLGSWAMNAIAAWGEAIVRPSSVLTSFSLSVLIGIFFGMYPALRAAKLDPIEALRYE